MSPPPSLALVGGSRWKKRRVGGTARWDGDGQSGKSEPRGQCPLTPRRSAWLAVGKGMRFGRWRTAVEGAGRMGPGWAAPGDSPPSCGSECLAAWWRQLCLTARGLPSTWTLKRTCQQTSQSGRRRLGSEQSQAGPGASGVHAPLKNQRAPNL